jgi:aspartate/methionine/tyrosine aminotransferase
VFLLCNPNNPTGVVQPLEVLEKLAALLRKPEYSNILVLTDEIYERLTYGIDHVCFAKLPGMYEVCKIFYQWCL